MTRMKFYLGTFAFVALLGCLFTTVNTNAAESVEKLTTEEIISRHLDSIGTKEARAALKTLSVVGKSKAVARGRGAGETTGIVVIASDGKKNMIGMNFNNNNYPGERIGFDGKTFTVGWQTQGQRSILGEFMLANSRTFRVGILGGVLSTSWELRNYDKEVGKLKCKGTSKIEGVKHHKCSYRPNRGSDLKITLFFHPETFRHVKTDYRRIISGGQGLGVNNSSRQTEKRYRLVENFSDFQDIGGLMMPHQYLLHYEMEVSNGSTSIDWKMDLANFRMNEKIDPSGFRVDQGVSE